MAAIIDGSTYAGFWKLTPDSSSPNTYKLYQKNGVVIYVADATNCSIAFGSDYSNPVSLALPEIQDEFGNALNTPDKFSQYISDNR